MSIQSDCVVCSKYDNMKILSNRGRLVPRLVISGVLKCSPGWDMSAKCQDSHIAYIAYLDSIGDPI